MNIAILAGGESKRMGRDKRGICFDGETLLERTVRVARGSDRRVVVVGGGKPDGWRDEEVEFLPDFVPGARGPIVGLATALSACDGDVLLLPCDLPLLTADLVDWLCSSLPALARESGALVLNGDQPEPLLSLYRPSLLPLLKDRVASSHRSLHRMTAGGDFARVDLPERFREETLNMNRPEDERRARKKS